MTNSGHTDKGEHLAQILLRPDQYSTYQASEANAWPNLRNVTNFAIGFVSAWTGYRKGEIGSLTLRSFDLSSEPPTVKVQAVYSKRKLARAPCVAFDATSIMWCHVGEFSLGSRSRQELSTKGGFLSEQAADDRIGLDEFLNRARQCSLGLHVAQPWPNSVVKSAVIDLLD